MTEHQYRIALHKRREELFEYSRTIQGSDSWIPFQASCSLLDAIYQEAFYHERYRSIRDEILDQNTPPIRVLELLKLYYDHQGFRIKLKNEIKQWSFLLRCFSLLLLCLLLIILFDLP
ncbi:MAG: hypothetical protein IJ042_01350 [Butyricicoccus sp.]|nr:hypothetical protein [Butyricicoccus sp.]